MIILCLKPSANISPFLARQTRLNKRKEETDVTSQRLAISWFAIPFVTQALCCCQKKATGVATSQWTAMYFYKCTISVWVLSL